MRGLPNRGLTPLHMTVSVVICYHCVRVQIIDHTIAFINQPSKQGLRYQDYILLLVIVTELDQAPVFQWWWIQDNKTNTISQRTALGCLIFFSRSTLANFSHMARASIKRATPFFQCHRTQQQITKAAESNLVTVNRVLMCFWNPN